MKTRTRRRTVSGEGMARILGVTDRWVRQLAREGHIPKARHGRYNPEAVKAAYAEYQKKQAAGVAAHSGPATEEYWDMRWTRARAERTEMENQVRRGELIPLAIYGEKLEEVTLVFRQGVLRLPQLAPELEGESIASIREKLKQWSIKLLGKISSSNGTGRAAAKPAAPPAESEAVETAP